MRIDITSMFFNSSIEGQTATPAWGTSIGQNKSRDCRIDDFKPEIINMVIGMTYKSVSDLSNLDVSKGSSDRDILKCSVFDDIFINNKKLENTQYVLLLVREHSKSHDGRLLISYAPYITYNGIANSSCIDLMRQHLGCNSDGCWFVYDISIKNQSELHFSAVVVNSSAPMVYRNIKSKERSNIWKSLIPVDEQAFSCLQKYPLQQIFYGAPGTGKSHTVNEMTAEAETDERVFRTTFHPDSDYSTFVGAYKPSMTSSEKLYTMEELIVKLNEIKNTGTTYPCHKFSSKYWESLKDLSANEIKKILAACGFTEAYGVEVSKGVAIGQEYLNKRAEGKIIYSFTPQAFTNAYVKAWNTEDDVYLIIEEINRGNCAQIFGDLFQLLDRNDEGFSKYPVDADTDLKDYINTELQNSPRTDFPNGVKEGKKLVLPSNLYIWATMNTSDQSLFPIDSAFKRRWEWKYIPIKNHENKNYIIEIGESKYDWWEFLKKINAEIGTTTSSEDKKLGYFFVKSDDEIIKAEQFVGKVLFYLWNDVFKNYGFDNTIFNKKEGEKEKLEFSDFFNTDGDPNYENVNLFLKNLGLEEISNQQNATNGPLVVIYKGDRIQRASGTETYIEIIKRAINDLGVQQVADTIGNELTQNQQGDTRRYVEVTQGWFLATNVGRERIKTNINKLKDGLSIDIEIVETPIPSEA